MIAGRGHAVDFVERGHRRKRPRVEPGLVRLQVNLTQLFLGHVDGIVVEPRLRGAIGREMLDAGEHVIDRSQIVALETPHPCCREQPSKQHVLATALDAPAPALISGEINHRREIPVDARAGRLERRCLGGATRQFRLEARHLAQANRKNRSMPVKYICSENKRDLHSRFAHRGGLHDPRHLRAIPVKDAGQLPLTSFVHLARKVSIGLRWVERERRTAGPGCRHYLQLPSLFLQRHAANQRVNECRSRQLARRVQERARRARNPG